jgi:hypothetical protein
VTEKDDAVLGDIFVQVVSLGVAAKEGLNNPGSTSKTSLRFGCVER